MGDPFADDKAIIDEYTRGVYGNAAGAMTQFFDLLEARLSEVIPIEDNDIAVDGRNIRLSKGLTTSDMYIVQYPPEFLAQLEKLLQQAEREADTHRTRGWVRLSRGPVRIHETADRNARRIPRLAIQTDDSELARAQGFRTLI